MDPPLSDLARRLLDAIATGPASKPVGALAESAGCSAGEAAAGLSQLEIGGLVASWARPAGAYVTLTPLEAGRRKLEIGPRGTWKPAGSRDASDADLKLHGPDLPLWRDHEDGTGEFLDPWDPTQREPLEELVAAEDMARKLATMEPERFDAPRPARKRKKRGDCGDDIWENCRTPGRTPHPRILLGLRVTWPVPIEPVCPGCQNKPLRIPEVCLLCLASGLDPWLPPPDDPVPEPTNEPARFRPHGKIEADDLARV